MEAEYIALSLALFLVTYIACWALLAPLAESKGYTVTYQRAIPVVNLIGLVVILLLPRRSPRRRLLAPEEQQKRIRVTPPEEQQKGIRVTPPDEHGRYR